MRKNIDYGLAKNAWSGHTEFLKTLIIENQAKKVCDVGGGANPAFSLSFIEKYELDYTLADIDAQELNKAPDQYNKVEIDFTKQSISNEDYDLIFTKMVMEHVKDVVSFHTNILRSLRPNGLAFHFFPCLSTLPFIVNHIVPEGLASSLLSEVYPKCWTADWPS